MFLQEAFDIFGDVGELLEMYDARRRTDQDEAAEQEPDFEDHDAEAADYYKDQASLLDTMLLLSLSAP